MATTGNRRQIDPTPLYAVVGVTDLAVERVRAAARNANQAQLEAQKALTGFDPRSTAQEVPTRAVAAALTVASRAESQYEELAKRGKNLYERVRTQRSTQDLLNQAGNTLSRTKGAVTTARKAADDTASAVRGTLNIGRREAAGVVGTTEAAAGSAADTTRRSARKTTTRAQKNAAATKSAAKGVKTSASKTASATKSAAKDTADKVGD
jgi:heparin binding hemagglutinin HbhA